MPNMTDAEWDAATMPADNPANISEIPVAPRMTNSELASTNPIPLTQQALRESAAVVPEPLSAGAVAKGGVERRLQELGKRPGVPFHEEGMDVWTDLLTKARDNKQDQLRYLSSRFGPENVRLNELKEPVVQIVNPDTGKPEDYPLDPHALTLKSLTGLARFAPDIALSALGVHLAGKDAGFLKQALYGALGNEAGAAGRAAPHPLSGIPQAA